MTTMKKHLISFVGTNDGGKLLGKDDGAILTALKNEKYDNLILLWNENLIGSTSYSKIVEHIKDTAQKRKLVKTVSEYEFKLPDVTDHNDIYKQLLAFSENLSKSKNDLYTAAISSGTPSMQVCWILLAESGDFSELFPLRLIKIQDPKFGKSRNIEVKLETSLPKILRLKTEVESLKKNLIPNIRIDKNKGIISIDDIEIVLSPIEFCYYLYFAQRRLSGAGAEKFSGIFVPLMFMESIYKLHQEIFPALDTNREYLRSSIKKREPLGISTFRGNITKLNKRIKKVVKNEVLQKEFIISSSGMRGAKFYNINADPNKIMICH